MKKIVAVFLLLTLFVICSFAIFAFVDDVNAQSINQRVWLIEYEGVVIPTDVNPYPAPVVVIPTDMKPYPAPLVNAPTIIITKEKLLELWHEGNRCILEPTDIWQREFQLTQAYFFTNTLGYKVYCFGNPPNLADAYKTLPTPAPTMDVLLPYPAPPTYAPPYPAPPYPAPPYPAPPVDPYPAPPVNPYPAPPVDPYPAPPVNPYPAP